MLFRKSYPQSGPVHLLTLIKENSTGNTPKVTLGSEIGVFGYFFLDTRMLYETFFLIFLFFIRSKGKKNALIISQIYPLYLCCFWTVYTTK